MLKLKPRLYLRLYLAFLGIAVLSLLATALLARAFHQPGGPGAALLVPLARSLDCAQGPCQGDGVRHLAALARRLDVNVTIWDEQRNVLFSAGATRLPTPARLTAGWHRSAQGPLWLSPLGDGRVVGLHDHSRFGPRGRLFLPLLAVCLVVLAVGLYPLSRSITRRVEALSEGARRWSTGDLAHRVPIQGNDEIALLAKRFNQAARAVESLLKQERQMLATASHELRSPLARLRVALELVDEEADAAKRSDLVRRACADIAELDALVEELLVAARTQPGVPRRPFAEVDLLALLTAEATAVGADVAGEPLRLPGEAAMLTRMVRNLLVNARVHGEGSAIRAEVRRDGQEILIAIEDDGPGVPEAERERIFAPFYRPPGPRPPGDSGLGLGLALCRQVARYHGGDVTYVARQPKGSRFEVRLPGKI